MKEKTIFNISKSKGELNMKRTIVILALVTAFVLAFTAVAQATWRGFTPVRVGATMGSDATYIVDPIEPTRNIYLDAADRFGVSPVHGSGINGFITFPEARAEMNRNLNATNGNFRVGGAFAAFGHRAEQAAAIQGTAHGGYVTTTTKCVVCHSAHRATGLENPALAGSIATPGTSAERNVNQAFLTAGASSCIECHVIWGSQPSRLLVEWGGSWGAAGTSSGGPHSAPGRGCTMCHNAGIHGLSSSRFNVMNVFMLGNTRRGSNPALDNRDDQIAAEMHLWTGQDSRNQWAIVDPVAAGMNANFASRTLAEQSQTWWYDGNRSIGPIGGQPMLPGGTLVGGVQYGAARSMATAYTCSEAGCHTTGAFFLTNWGVGKTRADSVRMAATQAQWNAASPAEREDMLATPGNNMVRIGDIQVTGHVMPSTRHTGMAGDGTGSACGPCHGGNPAGFPTASTLPGQGDPSRRAWGCDQCHDMVGVATNSTAWPHGNRNIVVYEWTAAGQQLDAAQTLSATGTVVAGPNIARAGNLWMYAGSIARADIPGMPIHNNPGVGGFPFGPNMNAAGTDALRSGPTFQGPTSVNPSFADQSWFVMTNVGSGRYGVPSNAADTLVANTGTGLVDGTCLKCHVALDSASFAAAGAMGADALRHAWRANGTFSSGDALNPVWLGQDSSVITGSNQSLRLFLYR